MRLATLVIGRFSVLLVLLTPLALQAEEPCQQFLDALREQRLFDVALDYLDEMQDSPLASDDFRERIPLLKVAVLLDEANRIRDPRRLTSQLEMTEQILTEFIGTAPPAGLLAEAQEQRARIFMARAGRLLNRAESDRITAAQKSDLQEQARNYLNLAGEAYEEIRQRLRDELTQPEDPQNPNARSQREVLRNKYVATRLQSPRVKEQIADSYGSEHPRYRELLQEAASENLELYNKYRTRLSGIDGCLGAARCYQKLGESEKALGHLIDVFDLPRGGIQTTKKREAALIAIDAWETMQPYPLNEALARLQSVVFSLSPEYARTRNGVKIRMAFAEACKKMADRIKEDGPRDAEERRRMVTLDREATKIMRGLTRTPGDHRQKAQQLLADWGNSVAVDIDEEQGPPETMAEARDRGKDLQLRVAQLKAELDTKQDQLAQATDETTRQPLEEEVTKLQERIAADSNAALRLFELGLSMTTDETADDDLSNLRYLQCASYFQKEYYFEAAIIGEFLIENFPDNSGTRSAAGLVCKAYWQMYRDAGKVPDGGSVAAQVRSFELQKLKEYCDLIFDKWPSSRQAEEAGVLMTLVSLSNNDPDAADQYLARIPEDSPTRAAVVLEVGNQLWRKYVRGQRDGSLTADELVALRDRARKLLENGVSFLNADEVTDYQARSALSLTELYLDAGENDLALQQLESATVAPLDLVKNKHPAAATSRFRKDTYKTSLRTYLAKLRDGEDTLRWVEKSQSVLSALKAEIGETEDGKKELSNIYLTLASELKRQFDSLEDNKQRSDFAEGLESFLSGLGSEGSGDRALMLLTASMLSEIGLGLQEFDLTTQANRFFQQGVKVYEELNRQPDPDARRQLAIQRGLANCLRGSGQFEEAIRLFGDILENPANQVYIDLQVDAASTFTEWGWRETDRRWQGIQHHHGLEQAGQGGTTRQESRTAGPGRVQYRPRQVPVRKDQRQYPAATGGH